MSHRRRIVCSLLVLGTLGWTRPAAAAELDNDARTVHYAVRAVRGGL